MTLFFSQVQFKMAKVSYKTKFGALNNYINQWLTRCYKPKGLTLDQKRDRLIINDLHDILDFYFKKLLLQA
jgi:hypothetical protein